MKEDKLYEELKALCDKGIINPKEWGAYNYNYEIIIQVNTWIMGMRVKKIANNTGENKRSLISIAQEAEQVIEKTAPTISKIVREQETNADGLLEAAEKIYKEANTI